MHRAARSASRRGQAFHRGQGQPEPVGTVVRLVANLVAGLLELERGQQRTLGWTDGAIGAEEGAARLGQPATSIEAGRFPLVRARGVIEAAQEARDVAQRRPRQPALLERPGRLALEIDDAEAAIGPGEKLAEVI